MPIDERSNTKMVGQATRALLLGAAALYSTAAVGGPVKEAEACYSCAVDGTYAWCSWSTPYGVQGCYITTGNASDGCSMGGGVCC